MAGKERLHKSPRVEWHPGMPTSGQRIARMSVGLRQRLVRINNAIRTGGLSERRQIGIDHSIKTLGLQRARKECAEDRLILDATILKEHFDTQNPYTYLAEIATNMAAQFDKEHEED